MIIRLDITYRYNVRLLNHMWFRYRKPNLRSRCAIEKGQNLHENMSGAKSKSKYRNILHGLCGALNEYEAWQHYGALDNSKGSNWCGKLTQKTHQMLLYTWLMSLTWKMFFMMMAWIEKDHFALVHIILPMIRSMWKHQIKNIHIQVLPEIYFIFQYTNFMIPNI